MRFKSIYVEKIPIPNCNDARPIEKAVHEILAAKKVNPKEDVSKLEHKIDEIVYQLYGLTEEERKIVEGADSSLRSE